MYYALHLMLFNCFFFSVVRPIIELLPKGPVHIREGDTANLTCKIIDGLPKPQISWLKDEKLLAKDVTLILTNVTDKHEGWYTCIAQNAGGNVTDRIHVTVKSKCIIIIIILTIKILVLFC